jgi:Ca-activated chloride channel family protein
MTRKKSIIIGSALVFAMVSLVVHAQTSEKAQTASNKDKVVKVDVDLVRVDATVTDTQNRVITGLDKEHFKLWEDKLEQKIEYFSAEDSPVSLGIVFDISGSMKDKIGTARDAAVTFLKTGNPEDEYFLEVFSNRPQVAEDFTSDISKLQNKLVFQATNGMTAMYDAVYVSLEKLKEGTHPKKALLLITDGEDNHSRYAFSNVREFVKEQNVQVYAIGIVSDFNSQLGSGRTGRALLEELADLTGGHAFFPDSVYDLEDICTKIAVELKNQYVLSYKSTNVAKDGKWRKIKVQVDGPKGVGRLNVRFKGGYYAAVGEPGPGGNKK